MFTMNKILGQNLYDIDEVTSGTSPKQKHDSPEGLKAPKVFESDESASPRRSPPRAKEESLVVSSEEDGEGEVVSEEESEAD